MQKLSVLGIGCYLLFSGIAPAFSQGVLPTQLQIAIWVGNQPPATLKEDQQTYQTTRVNHTPHLQKMCVADGQDALLSLKQSFPSNQVSISTYPAGVVVNTGDYKDIANYILVTPHVVGDKVQLKIRIQTQQLATSGDNNITGQALTTNTTVPFGEWVQIAGISNDDDNNDNDVDTEVTSTANRGNVATNYYVRVKKFTNGVCQ